MIPITSNVDRKDSPRIRPNVALRRPTIAKRVRICNAAVPDWESNQVCTRCQPPLQFISGPEITRATSARKRNPEGRGFCQANFEFSLAF